MKITYWALTFCIMFLSQTSREQVKHAPAYPLITHNPYFSIWSKSDNLAESTTAHWTNVSQSLIGLIKVDGTVYRFLGKEPVAYKALLATAEDENYTIKYTEKAPDGNWKTPGYNDRSWSVGKAPIGNFEGMDHTLWKTRDIWIRRKFVVDGWNTELPLLLKVKHDDGAEVFLNGIKVYEKVGPSSYKMQDINPGILKKGENILAIHVVNTGGGAYIDAGILQKEPLQNNSVRIAKQLGLDVTATQTKYNFACGGIELNLTFTSPLLLNDLNLLSRPVSYISYTAQANDGKAHNVSVLLSVSSDLAVNSPAQKIVVKQYDISGISVLKAGTVEQPVLKKKGDDIRIDWGYLYLGVPKSSNTKQYVTSQKDAVRSFTSDSATTTIRTGKRLALNTIIPFGKVGSTPVSHFLEIGYDELYSIQYFHHNLRPWWNKSGNETFDNLLMNSATDYAQVMQKCENWDKALYRSAQNAGGEKYADLCVLAYRQSIAAHQLVQSPEGDVLWLSKENFSNGSINTVDVTYPSAPLFLLYNVDLVKGMLNGIFYYSESGKWGKNFAAHDLGKFPIANGQLYGGDMPVEESGNMVILTAAIAQKEGNAEYARKHWKVLTTWANYLLDKGMDPENQLCTDDFAGHFAHNTNLSIKAIMGIACYGKLAKMLGEDAVAQKYTNAAKMMAKKWMKMADDGDHYRLTFDKPGTWSQKYNLVWNKLLGLDIFPDEVAEKEVKYYLTKLKPYGLPLDSRKTYTKADWEVWTATLADSQADFETLISGLFRFVSDTPDRVPMTDWYETTNAKQVGFQARSVVGGYFIQHKIMIVAMSMNQLLVMRLFRQILTNWFALTKIERCPFY